MKFPPLAEVRKFLVAIAGAASEALAFGLLHGTAYHVVAAALAVGTAAGVFVVPNEPAAGGSKPAG